MTTRSDCLFAVLFICMCVTMSMSMTEKTTFVLSRLTLYRQRFGRTVPKSFAGVEAETCTAPKSPNSKKVHVMFLQDCSYYIICLFQQNLSLNITKLFLCSNLAKKMRNTCTHALLPSSKFLFYFAWT